MHWRCHWRLRRLKWTSTLFYSFLSISRWKPDECLLFWSSAQATLETWLVYCENLPQVRIFNSALIQGVVRVQYLFLSITQIWLLAMIPQLGLSGLCGLNGTFPSLNAVEFVNGVPNMYAALLHHDLARPIRGHWRVTPGLALISVPSCDPGLGQNYLTPTNKRSVYGWWFQIFPHLPGEVPRFHIILLLGSSLLPSCFPPSFPPFFRPSVLPPSLLLLLIVLRLTSSQSACGSPDYGELAKFLALSTVASSKALWGLPDANITASSLALVGPPDQNTLSACQIKWQIKWQTDVR